MDTIALLPTMTAQQIAEVCARLKLIVEISYIQRDGKTTALILARKEPSFPELLEAHISELVRS